MFCSKCGAKMDDSCTFCTECGARLVKPVAPEVAEPQEPAAVTAPVSAQVPAADDTVVLTAEGTAAISAVASADRTVVLEPHMSAEAHAEYDPMAGIDMQVTEVQPAGFEPDGSFDAPFNPGSTAVMPPVVPVGTSAAKPKKRKLSGGVIAAIVVALLLVLVLGGIAVVVGTGMLGGKSASGQSAGKAVSLSVVAADASEYPQVKLTVEAVGDNGVDFTLDSANVVVREGDSADDLHRITSVTVAPDGDAATRYTVSYSSDSDVSKGEECLVRVSLSSDSGFSGTVDATYAVKDIKAETGKDEASDKDKGDKDGKDKDGKGKTSGKDEKDDAAAGQYILPDSNSRYLTRSDIEGYSVEKLFFARNEIFARYGRGFQNEDLQEYFDAQPWYQKKYSPSEFDSMPSPLNDYERKNVDLIREVEKEKGSPYL